MPSRSPRRPDPRLACVLVALAALLLPACGMAGWMAHGAAGGKGKKKVQVKAQYLGLPGQKVAVMVAADEYILSRYPDSLLAVSRAVSARIAANIPDATLVPPAQVVEFQKKNPYWTTVPYGRLIDQLDVERLVVIDLIEYRTHDPGNVWVWQGMIAGEVNVMEAESEDPDNPVFTTTVRAQFPEKSEIGDVNTDDQTVEVGMLVLFTRDAAGLFYDHEIMK